VGAALAHGLLFLTLLPSTVQSSVALTSVARGNVAGAIAGATVSNVLGMALTPVLVLGLMGRAAPTGVGGVRAVLLQLLLPFAVGQVLQRWTGRWVRAHRPLTLLVDRGTILLVVFAAVAAATATGVWGAVSGSGLVGLAAACLAVLGVVLSATWWGGARLGLTTPDRITLLMCGSKKSLATGLPMASVLFPVATAATLAVPVILFHQLQLVVCAVVARRLALRPG
jgi:sodium/bile acid cotransporter 7